MESVIRSIHHKHDYEHDKSVFEHADQRSGDTVCPSEMNGFEKFIEQFGCDGQADSDEQKNECLRSLPSQRGDW